MSESESPAGARPAQVCPVAIQRALIAHTTMTLAYADEDGPQAAAVLYAVETGGGAGGDTGGDTEAGAAGDTGGAAEAGVAGGPVLYFVTSTRTRHGRALAGPAPAPARVAFTAQCDGQEWSALTGLQGRGYCRPLGADERAAGWRVYTARFPFVEESARLREALERTTLWELRPDWLRLIDNGRGFGHKEEWRADAGRG